MVCRLSRVVFLLIILTVNGYANQSEPDMKWKLVWSDEFDGEAGQSPDSTKWGYDIGTDWGNAQLEYDTDKPSNVSLDGKGNLAITARKESFKEQQYTSARIVTRNLFEPTYGKIEAKIKLPTGQGVWPAFWMLGNDIQTVSWPKCGEIDIMEFRGQETNINFGSVHGPGYAGDDAITKKYIHQNGPLNEEYHLFSIEWDEKEIKWFIDNVQYHSATPEHLDGDKWVYDHPFYIILNVAVGGRWVGPPNSKTTFPQTMLVDYVRVYKEL